MCFLGASLSPVLEPKLFTMPPLLKKSLSYHPPHTISSSECVFSSSPAAHPPLNDILQRWNDPSPMPPSPIPDPSPSPSPAPPQSPWQTPSPISSRSPTISHRSGSEGPGNSPDQERATQDFRGGHGESSRREEVITFDHLPNQSFRTAFILDRFSVNCTILYCSNDLLISSSDCIGRSFYDYVIKKDEVQVKSWVDCVKGWGVNERGQPSDGGFGFGRFLLITEGRDAMSV